MKSLLMFALGTIILASSHAQAQNACNSIFSEPEAQVRTSAPRESEMKQIEKWQISMLDGSLLGKSDTPPMYFVAEDGVRANYVVRSGGLNGVITHMDISGIGESRVLRGTLLLPVSGHTGIENAKVWAKQDTYTIYAQIGEGPNGDKFADYYNTSKMIPLVKDARSTDLVSRQDIEIPLVKGKQVRILYFRSGSGGPSGYPEGRLMLFSWSGN